MATLFIPGQSGTEINSILERASKHTLAGSYQIWLAGRAIRVVNLSVDAPRNRTPQTQIHFTSIGNCTEFPSLPHDGSGTHIKNNKAHDMTFGRSF